MQRTGWVLFGITVGLGAAAGARAQSEPSPIVLARAIREGSTADRNRAIAQAHYRGLDEAVGAIVARSLSEPNVEARLVTIDALGDLGVHREAPALDRALGDPAPAIRIAAARALGRMRERGSADRIARMLDDANPNVRRGAERALADLGGDRACGALARRFESNARAAGGDRGDLLDALGQCDTPAARGALRSALAGGAGAEREVAATALARMGDAEGIRHFAAILGGSPGAGATEEARLDAVERLAATLSPAASEALRRALAAGPPRVAAAAAAALFRRGDLEGLDYLVREAGDPDPQRRQNAIDTLDRLGVSEQARAEVRHRLATRAPGAPGARR